MTVETKIEINLTPAEQIAALRSYAMQSVDLSGYTGFQVYISPDRQTVQLICTKEERIT